MNVRDVFNTHLGLRAYLADALRRGELPLIDPQLAGGQVLIGNPNVVPLYPDNLLLLFGSTLWQLNAHFWIHGIVAKKYPYDPDKAKALLKEAYWDTNRKLQFVTYYGDDISRRLQAAMQQYWAAVGVQVELVFLDSGAWVKRCFDDKNFDLAFGCCGYYHLREQWLVAMHYG